MMKIITITKIAILIMLGFLFTCCNKSDKSLINLAQLKTVKVSASSCVPSSPILLALNDGKVGENSLDNTYCPSAML